MENDSDRYDKECAEELWFIEQNEDDEWIAMQEGILNAIASKKKNAEQGAALNPLETMKV